MPSKFSNIADRLSDAPMLCVAAALAVGILSGERWQLPAWLTAAGFVVCCAMCYAGSRQRVGLAYAAAATLLAGMMLPELHRSTASLPYGRRTIMCVEVMTEPVPKGGYATAEGRITAWRDGGASRPADDRVWLWIGCDSVSHGDRLIVEARLQENISRHADYSAIMRRRGYVGAVWVGGGSILHRESGAVRSLQAAAVAHIRSLPLSRQSRGVAEAMVTGSRSGITPELRRSYSRSGAAHVLALSGLHVGIVAAAVNLLLAWLSLLHGGHLLRNAAVMAAIWLFAAMGGMSPSLVRAAVMFSILQLSFMVSSRYLSLNALAATALLMLVFDSSYLHDLGFRLSVAAVAGIVLWGVPLCRRLRCGRKAVDALTATMAVGVCATLWTMPIISHAFGYVSWAGALISPAVIATATVIVACGAAAAVLPAGWLAVPIGFVLDHAVRLQNFIVGSISGEWCAIDWRMERWQVAAAYLLFAAITLAIWSADRKKKVTLPDYDDYIRHRTAV